MKKARSKKETAKLDRYTDSHKSGDILKESKMEREREKGGGGDRGMKEERWREVRKRMREKGRKENERSRV